MGTSHSYLGVAGHVFWHVYVIYTPGTANTHRVISYQHPDLAGQPTGVTMRGDLKNGIFSTLHIFLTKKKGNGVELEQPVAGDIPISDRKLCGMCTIIIVPTPSAEV